MNIWLLQANEPMPKVHDGQRLFRTGMIADELSKRGHNITWFATTFNHFKKVQMYNKDVEIEIAPNYKLELIWSPGYKNNISISRIFNHKYMAYRFRKMSKKMKVPDMIYVSFPTIDFAEEAIRYGKRNNIPVIVDIRDLWPDIFYHNISKLKRIIAYPYIQYMQYKTKKIMKSAYAINGISPKVVEWGLKKVNRVKSDLDKFFYMGYDNQENDTNSSKIEMDKNRFNMCFFGTLNNQFNFDIIIEIAQKIPNVDIYVCGLGEQYDRLSEISKTINNIKMLGWLGKEDLQYVLKNSKIGLAPYKATFDFQMSTSNKFAEYLSYGLPIIITSGGYMGDTVTDNCIGISDDNVENIVCELNSIIEDDKKYKVMSENAKRIYNEKFIAKKIYSDLVDYLQQIEKLKK